MNWVIGYHHPKKIEERLTMIRNPLIFKYFLHYYLKNYYIIGKDEQYGRYYIYCKKPSRGCTGHWVYKWDPYIGIYYDWSQANALLDKIREEKSQIIRKKRKQALKETSGRYFEEDGKILYKK